MKAKHVMPALKYQGAKEAIKWLCDTWGFDAHLVVPGSGDTIAHAQLVLGDIMIMLGSTDSGEYGKLIRQPADNEGKVTQAPYIVVDNPDWFYERARAVGAAILVEIKDEDYGGRGFTCSDIEGHIWNFGSYDPFLPEGRVT
jgi:uncharacterized glyoxalase superfamily protein PhnB